LLSGDRMLTVRGRIPSRLVEQAKKKTGIQSDSQADRGGAGEHRDHGRVC
jgi:hypothetical protein